MKCVSLTFLQVLEFTLKNSRIIAFMFDKEWSRRLICCNKVLNSVLVEAWMNLLPQKFHPYDVDKYEVKNTISVKVTVEHQMLKIEYPDKNIPKWVFIYRLGSIHLPPWEYSFTALGVFIYRLGSIHLPPWEYSLTALRVFIYRLGSIHSPPWEYSFTV